MKKMHWLGMVVTVGLVVALMGCAGGAKPENLIQKQVELFKTKLAAQDINGLMPLFSEKFEHAEWNNKAGAKDFMQQAKDMGYLEGLEIDITKIQKTAEGGKYKVTPIEVSGSFGSTTVELTFAKEGANWLIVGLDASDI